MLHSAAARKLTFRLAAVLFAVTLCLWAANARIFSHKIPRLGVDVQFAGIGVGVAADEDSLHFRCRKLPWYARESRVRFGGGPLNYSCDGAHYAADIFGMQATCMPRDYRCDCYSQSAFLLVGLPYWLLLVVSGGLMLRMSPPSFAARFPTSKRAALLTMLAVVVGGALDFVPDATRQALVVRARFEMGYHEEYGVRPRIRHRDAHELGRIPDTMLRLASSAAILAFVGYVSVRYAQYVRFLATQGPSDTSLSSAQPIAEPNPAAPQA